MTDIIQHPNINISARDMKEAVATVADLLYEKEIITQLGYINLCRVSESLKSYKRSSSWEIVIDREQAIEFDIAENILHEVDPVVPILSCKKISVNLTDPDVLPFENLDICVLILDLNGEVIARWHFDRANDQGQERMQRGPLTHIQFGGRVHGSDRKKDFPLKVPRWIHPPLDVILLCEAIVANFYPEKWDIIRENPRWCDAISKSQLICYSAYLNKMVKHLNTSETTILHAMDASVWR